MRRGASGAQATPGLSPFTRRLSNNTADRRGEPKDKVDKANINKGGPAAGIGAGGGAPTGGAPTGGAPTGGAPTAGVLGEGLDTEGIQKAYLASSPSVVVVDDLLSPRTLQAMLTLVRLNTVW